MISRIKKALGVVIALLMVLSLAACAQPTATQAPTAAPTEPVKSDATPAPTDEGGADDPAEPAEKTYDEKLTISMDVLDAEKHGGTAKDEFLNKKFNVEWQFIPVSWGDWLEKVRAWVAADDMPDLLWWDMKINHTAEFRTWASAGAFREIPADLSAWPELQKMRDILISDDEMVSIDGKLYGWPNSRNNPEWLHNAYYPMFAYRRDWAKAVGMYKEGDAYTWDEAKAMIKAVQEQDPGGNGAGNTFGMTSETWAFPGVFMEILGMAEDRSGYVKNAEGKYVPYFTTDSYREELKFAANLFREGYIWKDQLVVTGSEGADNFYAGRSFMFLGNNSPSWFSGNPYPKMVDTGLVSSTDDVAPMIIFSPKDDKSFWLTETEDYWTVTHFNHAISDKKMNRILDMWNWLLTEDGRRFRVAGLEGKDYTANDDGTITILWDKNPDGSFKSPYVDTAMNQTTPPGSVASPNETTRMDGFKAFDGIHEFIKTSPDYHYHPMNWKLNTFGGEQYSNYGAFDSDVKAKVIEIFASTDDIDTMWDAFLNEMAPKWAPVAAELDEQLG